MTRLIFLDFEASSMSPDSWPIEVGAAWIEADGTIASGGHLIRPDPAWPLDDWSEVSADVHGMALADLEDAPSALDVALWVRDTAAGGALVSDAPNYDWLWLDRLMEVAELGAPQIHGFHDLAKRAFDMAGLRALRDALSLVPSPHRAETDARRLTAAWRAAEKASGRG